MSIIIFTGISSLTVLIVGPGVSSAESNLQAADGENLGISGCFLGSVGRNFKAMSSISPWGFCYNQQVSITIIIKNPINLSINMVNSTCLN